MRSMMASFRYNMIPIEMLIKMAYNISINLDNTIQNMKAERVNSLAWALGL